MLIKNISQLENKILLEQDDINFSTNEFIIHCYVGRIGDIFIICDYGRIEKYLQIISIEKYSKKFNCDLIFIGDREAIASKSLICLTNIVIDMYKICEKINGRKI